ncbi:glycosyltransferase [Sphingobacterium paludis]|uniref:Putative glycosyltransferase n=1 Tax=Sphingobacterium paludis TaxID=1476465 RepID=A0A4R7CY89_9SPHI|nr:glycosyltransferase [Sphingobacterium paludis]TDS13280.1 putative glycosyltransferase [Sphingobacterium paludis]
MLYKFSFYIHHHGSGHITRAIAIATFLKTYVPCNITFLGSALAAYQQLIPADIDQLMLPMDVPTVDDLHHQPHELKHLHYAPLHVAGLLARNQMITKHFCENPETLCIVDVSCEILQLARLCGIPAVAIRQHGNRTDLAHTLAYDTAAQIIAPYPELMSEANEEGLYADKTLFTGGFSRYENSGVPSSAEQDKHIAILIGKGGSSLDENFIKHLQASLDSSYTIHVMGEISMEQALENVVMHGHLANPTSILQVCGVVICNAGHNCIMEMGSLRKRIICIPAERPFREQESKAAHLQRLNLAIVIPEHQLIHTDWPSTIAQAQQLDMNAWTKIMDNHALTKIADCLTHTYRQIYSTPQQHHHNHV